MTARDIIKECVQNGIDVSIIGIGDAGDFIYNVDGFAKSGTAEVYDSCDGKIYARARYEQVNEISSFEDLAKIAYNWNKIYCDETVFGWDAQWTPVWEYFGWITFKYYTVTDEKGIKTIRKELENYI